jgi:hypothetical protein
MKLRDKEAFEIEFTAVNPQTGKWERVPPLDDRQLDEMSTRPGR